MPHSQRHSYNPYPEPNQSSSSDFHLFVDPCCPGLMAWSMAELSSARRLVPSVCGIFRRGFSGSSSGFLLDYRLKHGLTRSFDLKEGPYQSEEVTYNNSDDEVAYLKVTSSD